MSNSKTTSGQSAGFGAWMRNHQGFTCGLVIAALCLHAWFIIQRAWMGDDAYITLRTVDNFVNGYGLVWNVGERVQVYTHPLWMFLISAFYAFTREGYFTTLILSLIISTAAAVCLIFLSAENRFSGLPGLFVLTLSGAYLDYSTSGLENPLFNLLLVLFAWVLFKQQPTPKRLLRLSFIASLGAVTRLDGLLLFLPALIYSFWQVRSWKNLVLLLFGQVPLIAWELFSVIYYGFPFPNTAYAKLNTTLSSIDLLTQGLRYFRYTWLNDPWTLIAILCGFGAVFLIRKRRQAVCIALGVLFYLAYVSIIGGDFMGGRFFTAPVVMSAILISSLQIRALKPVVWIGFFISGILLGSLASVPPWKSVPPVFKLDLQENFGVVDERLVYYYDNGLFSDTPRYRLPANRYRYDWVLLLPEGGKVFATESVGIRGYYAGPEYYIVDKNALCDPFLSRLVFIPPVEWRIGHFERGLPPGYLDTVISGKDHFEDAEMGEYYQNLTAITRGNIWSSKRWVSIIKMNLGMYDHLLQQE